VYLTTFFLEWILVYLRPVRLAYQPPDKVLFSLKKPAITNQPAVLFSRNKPAPAISRQPNEQTSN
jgi:hypothetical protein